MSQLKYIIFSTYMHSPRFSLFAHLGAGKISQMFSPLDLRIRKCVFLSTRQRKTDDKNVPVAVRGFDTKNHTRNIVACIRDHRPTNRPLQFDSVPQNVFDETTTTSQRETSERMHKHAISKVCFRVFVLYLYLLSLFSRQRVPRIRKRKQNRHNGTMQ